MDGRDPPNVQKKLSALADRVKSSSVKERTGGLDALKEILNYNRRGTKPDSLSDQPFHQIFDALFHFSSVERTSYLEANRVQIKQLSGKRLENCASALRLTVEIGVTRIKEKSVRALLDHVVQVLPVAEDGYCEPLASDYFKCMRKVLEHPAHVEHLSHDLWHKVVNFCVTGLEHVDDDSGTRISFGSYGRTASENANASMHRSSNASGKRSSRTADKASLSSRDAVEIVASLRQLVSVPNAPIQDQYNACDAILGGALTFLVSTKERGPLSKATNARQDAFAIISSVLSRVRHDNEARTLDLITQLVPLIKELWTSKESTLNQEILICLIYALDHIPLLLSTNKSFSEIDVESLVDVLYEQYSRSPDRDSLNQLQISDLNFSLWPPSKDDPFRTGSFLLRTGATRPEMQWTVVQLIAKLSASQDRQLRKQKAEQTNKEDAESQPKKQMQSRSLDDFLRRTDVPKIQLRLASLQATVFRISQGAVDDDDFRPIMQKFLALASNANSEISNWSMVGLSNCALLEATASSGFSQEWTTAWQLATRQVTSAATCRAACHLAECILRLKLVSHNAIVPSLEAIVSAADLYGPALLTDTSSSLMCHVVKLRASESSAVYNVTSERVLQWLQRKWAPVDFGIRSVVSDAAQQANARDILRVLYTCTDRACQEDVDTDGKVLGHICQAWLHRHKQQEFTSYLLCQDKEDSEIRSGPNALATCVDSDNYEGATKVSSVSKDAALLDFCISRLGLATDTVVPFSAKPQDVNVDMIRLLTNLCLVATELSCVDDFQDTRRLDLLSQQTQTLSNIVTGFVTRSEFDERNVREMMALVGAYAPPVSMIFSTKISPITLRSISKFAKILSSSLEDRRRFGQADGLDDDLDGMDIDSGMESQASHLNGRSEPFDLARNDLAAKHDVQSMQSSTSMSMQFFASMEEGTDSIGSRSLPASFVDYLISIPPPELLACGPVLVPFLGSDILISADDTQKFLDHFADQYLESYEYGRCEVALDFCIEVMTNLTTIWINPSNVDPFDAALEIYEWLVKTALPASHLSPNGQIRLADLLIKLMGVKADYGVFQDVPAARELNLPSVRTTLFSILKLGELPVKNYIVASIPEMFNLFVLGTHEGIFTDVQASLPEDISWPEGIALRLLAFSSLGSRWHTLLRRCVYHIFETAGEVPSSNIHAKACTAKITRALSLKDSQALFKLFAAQFLFTWLVDRPMNNIPFGIFNYSTLEQLLEDNKEEITAQLIMRQKTQDLAAVASLLKTTSVELVLSSVSKLTAYCVASDVSDTNSGQKNIREKVIRELIGKDHFLQCINECLPRILGQIFLSMWYESDIGKVFQHRGYLQSSFQILDTVKKISSSDIALPPGQQPLFRSRFILDAVERLCRRTNTDFSDLWKPPILVHVLRFLFDAIDPALGSLHACSIIRKVRVVLCLAGNAALHGYPLEMLLQTLRPFLTDHHCADDTIGMVQYLFAHGKASLVDRPHFLARIALLILLSLRAFLRSAQESTTQESQHKATMNKAQNFHSWFCSYLDNYPLDNINESLHPSFRAVLRAACKVRGIGNAIKDTAESDLLRELLDDENRTPSLVDRPSRDNALHMLCKDFELPDKPEQELFLTDADATAYSIPILRACQRIKVSRTFLLWCAKLLGRTFASQGQIENRKRDPRNSLLVAHGGAGLSESKTAVVRSLLDLFQSDERQHISYAEKTVQAIYMRFRQFRVPSEAVAFDQLLPTHLHEALDYLTRGSLTTSQSPTSWQEIRDTLRGGSPKAPQLHAQTWIKTLTIALAHAAADDALLGALPLVLSYVEGLAERIFPYILHEVLLLERGKDERVRQEISDLCESWFKQSPRDGNVHTRFLLRGLLYLRTQPVPAEDTPRARDQWVDVDYLTASEAASKCGMYRTALLLAEIATSHESGRPRRSSTFGAMVPNDLLLEIYTNINDPDAFYGVEQQPSLETVMTRTEHEGDGLKSLLYRSARLDSQLRLGSGFDVVDHQGIVRALSRLNVNSITQSLVMNQQSGGTDESTAASLLDTARKLEQWDVRPPDVLESSSGAIFKAFQTMSMGNDRSLIFASLDKSLLDCMRSITSEASTAPFLRDTLRAVAALTEANDVLRAGGSHSLREVWSTMESRQQWMTLGDYEDARYITSCRDTIFSSITKSDQLQKMIRLSLRASRTIVIESLLASSSISRRHGVLQDSLSTTTHITNLIEECQKCGIEVGGATTVELANVLWDQGEMMSSIKLLKGLQKESYLENQDISVSKASLLAQLGHHVAEARLEKPDEVIKSYLTPAVDALKGSVDGRTAGQVFHTFAAFCDQQLQNTDGQEDFARVKSLREQKQNELAELNKLQSSQRSSNDRRELRRASDKAKQWLAIDNREYQRLLDSRNLLLEHSLENYIRALSRSDAHDTDVLRFFALWLENADGAISNEAVERNLTEVPSWKFAILMNQLSSRIQEENSKFQSLLQSLVFRICTEHPYHGMYHIYAGMKTPGGKDQSAISRNAAAKRLAGLLEKSPSRETWTKIFQTNQYFSKLACASVDDIVKKSGKNVSLRHVPAAGTAGEVASKARVPPPTMAIGVRPDGRYEHLPRFVKFESSIQIAGGLSAPKILTVVATDGKRYKQLYKGGNDELRQDAIMEQVFEEVSNLMRNHRETRRRNLRIRTYKVVPLGASSPANHAGIIEFVPNSIALHEFVIPAHEKYYPKDIRNDTARKRIADVSGHSTDQRTNVYRQITKHFNPVMRFFFLERFKDPDDWFERRLAYTRSTAAISILGHVLGLGDRHLHNILLDELSGEVVHIDLGVAFETGRVLPVPEVVPFRLTRDIVDGMGITGVEGVFRRCCEFMLDALRREQSSIMTLLNVLRYDPLYSWSVSPLKAKQMQDAQEGPTGVAGAAGTGAGERGVAEGKQESRKKNDAGEADRALSVVQRKLNKTLSTTATVNELIQQATDERNLAVLFQGWSAWV